MDLKLAGQRPALSSDFAQICSCHPSVKDLLQARATEHLGLVRYALACRCARIAAPPECHVQQLSYQWITQCEYCRGRWTRAIACGQVGHDVARLKPIFAMSNARMSLRKIAVLATLPVAGVFFAPVTHAASVGTYYCDWCSTFTGMVDSDAMIFLKSEVNNDLESWRKGGENQEVKICNSSTWAVYQYTANGNFVFKSVGPNTQPPAVGGGGRPGGGGGWVGGGGGSVTVGPITKPPVQEQAN